MSGKHEKEKKKNKRGKYLTCRGHMGVVGRTLHEDAKEVAPRETVFCMRGTAESGRRLSNAQ